MNTKPYVAAIGVAGVLIMAGRMSSYVEAGAGGPVKDLIVSRIGHENGTFLENYGSVGGVSAYAIGTTSCNNGTELLAWLDDDQHPVIAQNIYRLKGGQFEQIGMSWLKHGFCAADSTVCGPCTVEPGCDYLGPGCSDTYGSSTNGFNALLGPRSEVNPTTGSMSVPWSLSSGDDTLKGRIQVSDTDLDPALNAGALYFGEGHYITFDDAGTAYANNNNAYRPIEVIPTKGYWHLRFEENTPTTPEAAAIEAWAVVDPGVDIAYVDVPSDGRFLVGNRCTDNGDGTWHYEYAVYNMNSDRAGFSFEVPVPSGATVTNIGFRDCDHHSGEPYSTVDWPGTVASGVVRWETVPFASNPNANALRWGTLFNFRFDADAGPDTSTATLGLFRPGAPTDMTLAICGPAGPDPDLDGNGSVGFSDLLMLISVWGPCSPGPCPADFDGNGDVGFADLLLLISLWS